ncbi:MAG: NFACT family protein [Clostridia bacterium]|nr:NFACT family protein [Clostridia bacterium]
MAFDACMMRAVLSEISRGFPDAKIEKVLQPQNDEIDLVIHSGKASRRLVLNAGPNAPRIQLSDIAKENPLKAPMFCMLLRKHIQGGRITAVRQMGFDRIAEFNISAYDDMGFPTDKKLICEIMGKYANIILLDGEYKIIAALKVIDFAASTVRQVLPGLRYQIPKAPNKCSPLLATREDFVSRFEAFSGERTVEKFITENYAGIATQIAHELTYRATGGVDTPLSEAKLDSLTSVFFDWQSLLLEERYTPTVAYSRESVPQDYSYMPISYLSDSVRLESFSDFAALFDKYFAEKDRRERIRQRAHDLINLLSNAEARTERKLAIQRESLIESERGESFKRYGDLITANIYKIQRGAASVVVTDYYDESYPEVEIPLDTRLSAAQNAQRMYKQYNKCKTAKAVLTEQIKIWERELVYLDTVRDFLDRAESEQDLTEIREELYRAGYSSKMRNYKPQKSLKSAPTRLKTSDGLTVLVGRNNIQNDNLTMKLADKDDVWFHVKDIPGSHVILQTEGKEPSDRDYTEAASIAAYYSKAKGDSVAVDYTRVKNIRKPSGSKPGFVTYKTNYTAFVDPAIAEPLVNAER